MNLIHDYEKKIAEKVKEGPQHDSKKKEIIMRAQKTSQDEPFKKKKKRPRKLPKNSNQ